MSNKDRSVLYIGVTSDLRKRVIQHKEGFGSVFTSKYRCYSLVYYEQLSSIEEAIRR